VTHQSSKSRRENVPGRPDPEEKNPAHKKWTVSREKSSTREERVADEDEALN